MGMFDYTNFMPVTSDGNHRDVFQSQFRNLRFLVPVVEQLIIGSAFAYNAPGLAHNKLGDAKLWWVLMAYNGLYDPRVDLYPGRVINIPDRQATLTLLQASSKNTSQVIQL